MIDRRIILQRLEKEAEDALVARIRACMVREDTRLISERSSKVSVSEALRLWTTRLRNTDVTGQQLHGAQSLLSRLHGLTRQSKLEQFAFVSPDTAGNLFFEGSSHHFVGAVLVDTRSESKTGQ